MLAGQADHALSREQRQPLHPRHVDVGQNHDQGRLDAAPQLLQCFHARVGEVHGVGALPHLAAEALPEQLCNVAFVVDHQNADRHAAAPAAARRGKALLGALVAAFRMTQTHHPETR